MYSFQLRQPTVADAQQMWQVRTSAILSIREYGADSVATWANVEMPEDFANAFDELTAVLCVDGPIVGGWGFANLEVGLIAAMFVDPACQRRGVGRMIFQYFEDLARAKEVRCLNLIASLNAVAFYERVGFIKSRATVFQHPSGFDLPAVEMTKELG